LEHIKRYGLIAAVAAVALLIPLQAASTETPPPVIEVVVSLTDLPPAVVNVTVPEHQPVIEFSELPAPVVNVDIPAFPDLPAPIVNVDVPQGSPEIIYRDRDVERIVEVPSCLDYSDLPYFDLANALTVAFPGEQWSLNGSHYNGLTWHGEGPQPDMTAIIGGWLAHLSEGC
jgi:hypothetical protein